MDKLELKYLSCYLPYGLKVQYTNKEGESSVHEIIGFKDDGIVTFQDGSKVRHLHLALKSGSRMCKYFYTHTSFKPILRPLSDLTMQITHDGETLVPSESLGREFQMNVIEFNLLVQNLENTEFILRTTSFAVIQRLIEWHFDVFDLIPAGLAISYKEAGL